MCVFLFQKQLFQSLQQAQCSSKYLLCCFLVMQRQEGKDKRVEILGHREVVQFGVHKIASNPGLHTHSQQEELSESGPAFD